MRLFAFCIEKQGPHLEIVGAVGISDSIIYPCAECDEDRLTCAVNWSVNSLQCGVLLMSICEMYVLTFRLD